jgi:ribosomal protein S18 acetylase RimI-like enzyme
MENAHMDSETMHVRTADRQEIDALAKLWYDSWQDAHAEILPAELARLRTLENLRERLGELWKDLRVVGDVGNPLGLSITRGDELNQLYVSREARGRGAAQKLISEVEERLAYSGVATAWLACAIGNARAARFYEKSGWHLARTFTNELDLPSGKFHLEVWRYEKQLQRDGE